MKLGELKHLIETMQEVTVKQLRGETISGKWYQILDYKNAEDWEVRRIVPQFVMNEKILIIECL